MMAVPVDDDEDDYLNMSFEDATAKKPKETSIQRTARLKKESAARGRVLSKAEREEQARAAREEALSTALDASTNKGAAMMAKMGFKGGALGKTEGARTQPIAVEMKDNRGGIGMEGAKKRKLRQLAEEVQGREKVAKLTAEEYRDRTRMEAGEKRTEGQVWGAMKVLEGFETGEVAGGEANEEAGAQADEGNVDKKSKAEATRPLRSISVLCRPLAKQRQERDRERRMRHDMDAGVFSTAHHASYGDDEVDIEDKIAFGTEVEDLDDEGDVELDAFLALSAIERLEKVVAGLREKYNYCFWCKYRYPDAELDGCPGVTEDEHG